MIGAMWPWGSPCGATYNRFVLHRTIQQAALASSHQVDLTRFEKAGQLESRLLVLVALLPVACHSYEAHSRGWLVGLHYAVGHHELECLNRKQPCSAILGCCSAASGSPVALPPRTGPPCLTDSSCLLVNLKREDEQLKLCEEHSFLGAISTLVLQGHPSASSHISTRL